MRGNVEWLFKRFNKELQADEQNDKIDRNGDSDDKIFMLAFGKTWQTNVKKQEKYLQN